MKPKYSEGESVILQSPRFPEYNGEYTVNEVLTNQSLITCRLTNQLLRVETPEDFSYMFSSPLADNLHGREITFVQSSLRKKHESCQMSFQSIIQSINSPVKQESQNEYCKNTN